MYELKMRFALRDKYSKEKVRSFRYTRLGYDYLAEWDSLN